MPVEAAVCNEPELCDHHQYIQSYFYAICGVLLKSGKLCIPRSSCSRSRKFGWDEDLKKSKRQAKAAFCKWKYAGKPHDGDLYKAMQKSRKLFRGQLNMRKRKEITFWCEGLAEDLAGSDTDSFWKKIRNGIHPHKAKSHIQVGDGVSEDGPLEYLKKQFSQIINSQSRDSVVCR